MNILRTIRDTARYVVVIVTLNTLYGHCEYGLKRSLVLILICHT